MTKVFNRATRMAAALASIAALSACSNTWFGEDEEILPGERIAVRPDSAAPTPETAIAVSAPPIGRELTAWPQMNGSAARSVGSVAAPADLSLVWRVDAGEGASSDSRIVSSPILADGRVYALDAESTVAAFDAGSGARIWRADLTPEGEDGVDGFGGGLAFENGKIVATSGFGFVAALDAASGQTLWKTPVGAPVRSSPAVEAGRVFVVARDDSLTALDVASGEIIWREQGLEGAAGVLGGGSPAVSGGAVIAPFSSGEVAAFQAEDGRPAWIEAVGGAQFGAAGAIADVSGAPAAANGVVVVSSRSGTAVAIDQNTGDRLWTRDIGSLQPAWIAGEVAYVMGEDGALNALTLREGDIAWRRTLPLYVNPEDRTERIVYGGPILAGGRLLLTANTGKMLSISPTSGEVLGEVDLPGGSSLSPIAALGTVYVLTDGGELAAYR